MVKLTRRQAVRKAAGLLFALTPISHALAKTATPAQFVATRIWPAHAYTRITVESSRAVRYQHFTLENPTRLVVDIENAHINQVLQGLSGKVQADDPFIRSIRVGQNTPTTVRLVVDLKQSVNPQVFTLAPVGGFKHRLVIDLYPQGMDPDDPMMALLNANAAASSSGRTKATEQPARISKPTQQSDRGRRKPVVVLDPGHGGEDPGAVSPNGLREKDVVLSVARETKKRLEAFGYTVHMTRNEDVFIPLNVRVAKARTLQADIFVSIHADSFTSPTARGTGVYILNPRGASSAAARFLAQTQNNADAIGGVQVSGNVQVDNAILDMTQTATMRDSRKLAQAVLNELGKLNKLHKGRVDEANFAVLRAPDIPSVLVETAFISNPIEEKLLASEAFRRQCAQAISDGVRKYLGSAVLRR
ncbi:N-acetylmuramoyl-L-alanine amidase [Neisseria animalis]|uniref:N-acetylmuramoyl-L-alanine amidase AmiC n=1 Tax=Neisseria animalis TaxID=492 RepID=A0A5P3MSI6_NEIAN|nr:N-acetylmuramoyl-L-alanine amidase [Neisseria animalis]QEY24577.1 N-acetylmuramoyl-L-alanine amidase [Neisseria animalis]ROW33008.1 N-acetylmuramoyl-L-alanine amidase [Neisseria animalis]VEE07409.1 N-acetylmuramoyl-L-alanine amidase [Neisseria animalis]